MSGDILKIALFTQYLQDMGQVGKAEEIMTKAAKTEPENSTVHFTLGYVHYVIYSVYALDITVDVCLSTSYPRVDELNFAPGY